MKIKDKNLIKNILEDFPDSISIEEVMERLFLIYKIEKGIQQANAGQTIPHEEVKQKLNRFLK